MAVRYLILFFIAAFILAGEDKLFRTKAHKLVGSSGIESEILARQQYPVTPPGGTGNTVLSAPAIRAPVSGVTHRSNTLTVSGSAPSNATSVKVRLDGGIWVTAAGVSAWQCPVMCTNDGTHLIEAAAVNADRTSPTVSVTAIIDTSSPLVTFISGPSGPVTTSIPFTVKLGVNRPSGYWSTNGSTFYSFTSATPDIWISNTVTLYMYGYDGFHRSATNQVAYVIAADYELEMRAAVDWGFSASEAYEDTGLTRRVSDQSPVMAFRAFGVHPPALKNLLRVTPDFKTNTIWYGSFGTKTHFYDYGSNDRFVDIRNGQSISFETDPGQVTGWDSPVDQIYFFRLWHGVMDELLGCSLKWRANFTWDYYGQNGEVFTSAPVQPVWGTDYYVRVTHRADRTVQVFLNGVQIISNITTAPYHVYEINIGTTSHPLSHHFRFYGLKKGIFTATEMNVLTNNSDKLWKRGGKPNFPYIGWIHNGYYTDFNAAAKTWTLPSGTDWQGHSIQFTGGTGTPGTHTYQWYYYNTNLAPPNDRLNNHAPLPGATNRSLNRNSYSGAGQPFYGHAGDSFNQVFCIITPVDSSGVRGLPITSRFYLDNIP